MNKKVFIISASLRKGSNSEMLAREFAKGALEVGSDYKFTQVYLLATAAEDEQTTVEGAEKAVQGWVDCFERAKLSGVIFAGGVNDAGDIAGHKGLTEAYEAGKNV